MDLFEINIKFAQAGVTELKKYLLSKELFWPIHLGKPSGHAPYPQLTIGNLLFYLKRAEACSENTHSKSRLLKINNKLIAVSSKWRNAWEEKAEKEFNSRLRQWQKYLKEFSKEDRFSLGNYSAEIKVRVLLELLSEEISTDKKIELKIFDYSFKSDLKAGEFIWTEEYASGFPKEKYWYLYGELK
jgi:hypothetical protein